jgi:[protein-PII] uridylyltransferase
VLAALCRDIRRKPHGNGTVAVNEGACALVLMPPTADFFWPGTNADADTGPPQDFVEVFASSMPSRYRVLFDPRTVRKHAGVSYRRGDRPAHAEVWRSLADGSAALCVVADDRPGLLSAIAAALISHKLDVITALVFSRAEQGEAVDLLWVRRDSPDDAAPIDADEAVSIGEVLSAMLAGSISVDEIASRTPAFKATDETGVVVRFDDVDDGGLAVLSVEAPDRPGVLLAITFELFQQGAQIARSLVRTARGRAFNSFDLVEFSGAPLSPDRRDQIRAAVLAALALGEE